MTTQQQMSRVERRKLATRQSMLDAGRRLVARHGISDLSVQSVTEDADVALGTFYNYFDDKLSLFRALGEEDMELTGARLPIAVGDDDDVVTQIAAITALGCARAWADREFAAYTWEMYCGGHFPGDALAEVFCGRHGEAVRQGLLPAMPGPLAMATYFGTTFSHCRAIAAGEIHTSLDDTVEALLDVILRGLGASDQTRSSAIAAVMSRAPETWWELELSR